MFPRFRQRAAAQRVLLAGALSAALVATAGCTQLKRWAYSSGDRDAWQQPERVVAALRIVPGARVADLGAGGGYFTFRLAEAVGEGGRVYAVDVDEAMLDALQDDIEERAVPNVEIVLADPDDAKLPEGEVDLVFTANTYHHIGDRVAYFRKLARSLSGVGRVAIVEFRPQDMGWFGSGHATPPEVIEREMSDAGYRLIEQPDFLDRQSFMIFAAPGG